MTFLIDDPSAMIWVYTGEMLSLRKEQSVVGWLHDKKNAYEIEVMINLRKISCTDIWTRKYQNLSKISWELNKSSTCIFQSANLS